MEEPLPNQTRPDGSGAEKKRSMLPLYLLLAVCIAPVVASYAAYYLITPSGKTNYGDLVSPQRDVTAFEVQPVVLADPIREQRVLPVKKPVSAMAAWRGRWVMVVAQPSACAEKCQDQLYKIRQVRLTTGKHRLRVERLWLLPDSGQPDEKVLAAHKGLWVARSDPSTLSEMLPAQDGGSVSQHIYLIDPLGNLMMRFPVDADANRMKKDINKLLKASRIG
jgi:hypothetical protein